MPNRDQMWGPMSLEDYAETIGQDLSQRPVDWSSIITAPAIPSLRDAPVAAPLPGDAVTVEAARPVTKLRGAGDVAGKMGIVAEVQKGLTGAVKKAGQAAGYVDDVTNFNRVIKGSHIAGKVLGPAGEALGALDDMYNKKLPWRTVVPGAVLHGGQSAAAGAIGGAAGVAAAGLIGQMLVPIPGLGYALGAAGGIGAGLLADKYLPNREQWGRGFHKP